MARAGRALGLRGRDLGVRRRRRPGASARRAGGRFVRRLRLRRRRGGHPDAARSRPASAAIPRQRVAPSSHLGRQPAAGRRRPDPRPRAGARPDPGAGASPDRVRVRYRFKALGRADRAEARLDLPLGLLQNDASAVRAEIAAACVPAAERDADTLAAPWKGFDASLPSCVAAASSEQRSITGARATLASAKEITALEAERRYLPVVVRVCPRRPHPSAPRPPPRPRSTATAEPEPAPTASAKADPAAADVRSPSPPASTTASTTCRTRRAAPPTRRAPMPRPARLTTRARNGSSRTTTSWPSSRSPSSCFSGESPGGKARRVPVGAPPLLRRGAPC